MSRIAPTLIALSLSVLASAAPAATTERQKATILAKPGVVYVDGKWSAYVEFTADGKTMKAGPYSVSGHGSGFFISPDGFVVTNGHVVMPPTPLLPNLLNAFVEEQMGAAEKRVGRKLTEEEKKSVLAAIQKANPRGVNLEGKPVHTNEDLTRTIQVLTKAGVSQIKELQRPFPAEVRAYSPFLEKDIAILKVNGKDFPTLTLGDSDKMKVQDPVTVLGYPGVVKETFEAEQGGAFSADSTMEPTITSGTISSLKTWKDGSPILGTDAATAKGNSGGPGLNEKGEVIGVLSMGAMQSPELMAFGFNFFRPINVAKDFIRTAGVEMKTSLTNRRWVEGMTHFFRAEEMAETNPSGARGEYDAAKTALRSVLELYPQHPDAGRYVVLCEEALARVPAGRNWMPIAWIVGGLLVVAGLVVGASAMTKRSREDGAAPRAPGAAPAGKQQKGQSGFVLVAEKGTMAGNRFPVPAAGLMFGRDPATAQIVITGETVSREHAKLQLMNGGLLLTNLSTTNPTYVNDKPAGQLTLKAGDRIQIGANVFLVTV